MPTTVSHSSGCSPIVVGHASQRRSLAKLLDRGRLPAVLLFAGMSGVGKLQVARELARGILCVDRPSHSEIPAGCGRCKHCHLFDAGSLPDYYQVDIADRDQSNVDSLRQLLYALNLRAFGNGARVVVFDNADELSPQATNLLLKSLEEPRSDLYFIVIAANPARLLPTLISRCQLWHFSPLDESEIRDVLAVVRERFGLDRVSEADLAELCDGSLARVAEVADDIEAWRELQRELTAILGGDSTAAFKTAERIAKDKDGLRRNLRLLLAALRKQLLGATMLELRARLALGLTNALAVERLITERNISPAVLMNLLLVHLLPPALTAAFTTLPNSVTLIDEIGI